MKQLLKASLLMLTLLPPATATAYDFEVDGIYYNINGNEASVTYGPSGFMYSGEVAIPSSVTYDGTSYTVTSISDDAFYYCTGLTSIFIPNSVSSIGDGAFGYCTGLTSIDIPNSVTSIGCWTFDECRGLTSVTIGNSITYISAGIFRGCIGLTSIDIPYTVTFIGEDAFANCSNLTSVNMGNSVTIIAEYAFSGCSGLKSFVIPNSVISIGYGAFEYCTGLSDITIGSSVREICDCAFGGCTGLTNVIIPNSVILINFYAFGGCSGLTNITIGNSISPDFSCYGGSENYTFSVYEAFLDCDRLSSIFITGEGEWIAGYLPDNISALCIDEGITGVNGMRVKPQDVFCFATTPPTCDENSFTDYSGTLHVPATSLAAYFTAPYWCNFNLVGDAVKADSIKVNHDSIDMLIGEETTLIANIFPVNATSNVITWASSNPEVAAVVDGVVTAMAAGECEIYAMCLDHKAACHIIVYSDRISLNPQEAQVLPNHILTLTPTSLAAQLPELAVTSSDATVAAARMLNGKVQVVGIKEGTATITVNAANGTAQPATCLVTVYTECGDMNVDGYVNIADVTTLIDYLLSGNGNGSFSVQNADVNQDGIINIADVTALIDLLLSGG